MKKPGRPSSYTSEIAEEICDRLSIGEPLRNICRDDHMPAWRTVYDWAKQDIEAFSARIARARDIGFDALAEQCLDIADDERHDWLLTKKGVIANEVAIGRAKLQVDTRLRLLAKWSPKYRENTRMELTGADGGPVQFSDTERAARIAAIFAGAAQRKAEADVADLL